MTSNLLQRFNQAREAVLALQSEIKQISGKEVPLTKARAMAAVDEFVRGWGRQAADEFETQGFIYPGREIRARVLQTPVMGHVSFAFLCWTNEAEIIKALRAKVAADYPEGAQRFGSVEEAMDRLEAAEAELLEAERAEYALLLECQEAGLAVEARADTDARVLLGIAA